MALAVLRSPLAFDAAGAGRQGCQPGIGNRLTALNAFAVRARDDPSKRCVNLVQRSAELVHQPLVQLA